jgi:hypothetical protein
MGECIGSCEPGSKQCATAGVSECDDNGEWQVVESCSGTCEDAACVSACSEGKLDCLEGNAVACTEGEWVTNETCAFACEAGACTGECKPNETVCVDGLLATCGADASYGEGNACPFACVDDACAGECVPGSTECASGAEKVCGDDAHWGDSEECEFVCDGDVCGGECTPGTSQCSDSNTSQVCSSDGNWGESTDCEDSCNDARGLCEGTCEGSSTAGCDDGNDCTTSDKCNGAGQCSGTAMACPADNACTTGQCTDGSCAYTVNAGSCLIAGACYTNGAANPNQPCQVCNATANAEAWSSSPNTTTCDDGIWCNGDADKCDGAGACGHTFPANNRCDGSGPCERASCDAQAEAAKNCFKPTGTDCDDTVETSACNGGNLVCDGSYTVTETAFTCSGSSETCDIETESSGETVACETDERCEVTGNVAACVQNSSCIEWCDAAEDLCWLKAANNEGLIYSAAKTYCESGTWGGKAWRLPTVHELITLMRGCVNVEIQGAGARSPCRILPDGCANDCNDAEYCGQCTAYGGPDASDGCYWPEEITGECSEAYWTTNGYWPNGHYYVQFSTGFVFWTPDTTTSGAALCMRSN